MRWNEAGVTLVETMVIVTIMGLVAVSVMPKVGTAIADSAMRGAVEQVGSAFRMARQNALSTAATYQVTVTPTTIAVSCTTNIPLGNICPASRPPDRIETVKSGVGLTPSVGIFNFGPTGVATVGTVNIAYGSITPWQVALNAAGRVRACLSVCT